MFFARFTFRKARFNKTRHPKVEDDVLEQVVKDAFFAEEHRFPEGLLLVPPLPDGGPQFGLPYVPQVADDPSDHVPVYLVLRR